MFNAFLFKNIADHFSVGLLRFNKKTIIIGADSSKLFIAAKFANAVFAKIITFFAVVHILPRIQKKSYSAGYGNKKTCGGPKTGNIKNWGKKNPDQPQNASRRFVYKAQDGFNNVKDKTDK
jgi:hypothetical protein